MEPPTGPRKGLLTIIVILTSGLLLSSGALLPKAHNSGRFWEHAAPQYPPLEGSIDLNAALLPWGTHLPSIMLHDWSLKWMSSDVTAPQDEEKEDGGQNRKSLLWGSMRQEASSPRDPKVALYPASWVPGWGGKRSIVVADDAAFREKSKLLTAMQRQKWLNSYMQKLLVVNSD
ncbi:tuberoinfundibular peptide of 39 residues [Elgaria multicarinata webbii]|uniref:tuberoinfundibular peptide of 39 residues n=1 Tax=Elgaria multicarinata webbii TaxID=159646 RepID=UPI002FCD0BFB